MKLNKVEDLLADIFSIPENAVDIAKEWLEITNLFTAAIEPKQLLIVPGAGHNNVRQVGGILYHEALRQFIEQY